MASSTTPSKEAASLLLFATLLGLLLSVTLCVFCKKKCRKKKGPVEGVKLVDVSLMRQTQLRSLSKSDTKLHELKRVQTREQNQRPASMDFFDREHPLQGSSSHILQHRQLPKTPPCNPLNTTFSGQHIYSNLRFTVQPLADPSVFYESARVAEAMPLPSIQQQCNPAASAVRQEQEVIAEYARVRKGNSPSQSRTAQDRESGIGNSTAKKVEEMYSTVCKKRPHNPVNILDVEKHPALTPQTPDSVTVFPKYGLQTSESGECSEGPGEPPYETINVIWKKEGARNSAASHCAHENFYESISEVREAESRASKPRNGLEIYRTGL